MNVSSPTGIPDDDAYWQRPDPGPQTPGSQTPGSQTPGPASEPSATPQPADRYEGPPRPGPPSPHWRPPTIAQPPAPRSMPAQDMAGLDEAEGSARTVTYGIGLVAGAIALILLCLLCSRAFF